MPGQYISLTSILACSTYQKYIYYVSDQRQKQFLFSFYIGRQNQIQPRKKEYENEISSAKYVVYRVFQLDMLHFKRLLGHQKSTFKA